MFEQTDDLIGLVKQASTKYKPEDLAGMGIYAETGQKIASFVDTAASAFEKLQPQRFNLRGQINLAFENVNHALDDLAFYSKHWKVVATDDVRDVSDNVAAVMADLNTALDPLTKFNQLLDLDDSTIDLGIDSVKRALDRFSTIADSPILQGQSLQRLKAGSDALGSAFTGLKTATDTILGLTSVADATGSVDIASDLDQLFLTQVPAWADSWETSMNRIQNSGARARGALGLPQVNAQAAGGGGDGGTVYQLTINGLTLEGNSDIGELIRKIMDHQSLVNGGPRVGSSW